MPDEHLLEQQRTVQARSVTRRAQVCHSRRPGTDVYSNWQIELAGERPERLQTLIVGSNASVLCCYLTNDLQAPFGVKGAQR